MSNPSIAPTLTAELPGDFLGFERLLSGQERELLGGLRDYLDREVRPIVDEHWAAGTFPRHLIKGLADAGATGHQWAETRRFENSAVFRGFVALEMARVDASVATYAAVQNGLAMGAIGVCGSDAQRAEWLPRLNSGEVVGAFGLTEPQSGSDIAQGLATSARRDGDSWVLNGQKRWIGNATFSDVTIIWARDVADGQVKGFIVPTDTPGYTATRIAGKQSLRMVQNAVITLEGVRVPNEMKLEHANSFKDVGSVLRLTRADVAWLAVGNAMGAYEAALAYAKEREQFGRPIASRQLVQQLLVQCLADVTSALSVSVRVAQLLDDGAQRDEHSALAKAFATERMRDTVAKAREVLGGNGILLDHAVMRHFADAEGIYSYEGTREINTLIVGRAITGHAAFVH